MAGHRKLLATLQGNHAAHERAPASERLHERIGLMVSFNLGDRAPFVLGATQEGRFYSPDAQAGRPAVLVSLGTDSPWLARERFLKIKHLHAPLLSMGMDLVPLAPQTHAFATALGDDVDARRWVVHVATGANLDDWTVGDHPLLQVVDRGGRIVAIAPLDDAADLIALCRSMERHLKGEPGSVRQMTAPVLMLPNILAPTACRDLISHFEASAHRPGRMAGLKDGEAVAKIDEDKKRRRDIELTAQTPIHAEIVTLFANRCAPEIKRAFQAEISFADRVLLARYDDSGGYFRRHRDNVAPQTAFREFAISVNLNTSEYEGGELLFPEYDDHRYNPPAGGALIFSASLLHEAAPVTRGRRYVLLSFLCTAAAQGRVIAA